MVFADGLERGETTMKSFQAAVKLKFSSILSNINKYRRSDPLTITYTCEEKDDKLWLHFSSGELVQSLSIRIPYRDSYGNYVLGTRAKRSIGTWQFKDVEYNYWQLHAWLLTGRIEEAFPHTSKRSQLERIITSFEMSSAPLTVRSFQDLADGIINKLPLTGTPMETWAMCQRVIFIDPSFEQLTPQEALTYQKELNQKHFPWTSVGLSDSGMCNNNLLKQDLRKFTPFGLKHHNPMRNLYQTLGMKGSESPLVQTESMAKLTKDTGVARKGWNLMTCFLDTPLNFEDQLIVDNRHQDKFTLESKRFACFGDVQIKPGDELSEGAIISMEPNEKPLCFWTRADRAVVTEVSTDTMAFNGKDRKITVVYVETKHIFKEGVKLTNCHGNKGVITFADCGNMLNRADGSLEPIDIIVSAKTIGKRKNYGQVLEVLLSLARGKDKPIIIPDDTEIDVDKLKSYLASKGYHKDGTSPVMTQWFEGNAICGWGFWGLIKNPENQLWTKSEVTATDNRDRRIAGVKISHIEFKGLTTIFGPKNPIVDEILTHQQGFDDVHELIQILEPMRGASKKKAILDWSSVKPLTQGTNYFHLKEEILGTIVDEDLLPEGFMLQLPLLYHIYIPTDDSAEVTYSMVPEGVTNLQGLAKPDGSNVFLDKVYVPAAGLRACWQHTTGLWGLSDIGGHLNNIVTTCHRLKAGEVNTDSLLRVLNRYFGHTARRLSTKRGDISTYALAVRYPHSVKAIATLAKEGLPFNWVEIHRDMANDLGVSDGDYVIAERFPCLGFKSLRIQRVSVTDDMQCKYVIRVSGNSLVSQNLDFDGDVLFLMSFKTAEANALLAEEFANPNELRKFYIDEANEAKVPCVASASLDTIGLTSFDDLTAERQADIVGSLTGLKRGTGTTVALAYNVMRIIEGNVGFNDKETSLALEVIMDKVANSVFGQKHDGVSLEVRCKAAICTADLRDMLAMGFPKEGSRRLCEIITKEANSLGITDLKRHYDRHLTRGHSNVINVIVRKKYKFYFATRANLGPVRLLQHLESPAVDLTSHLWLRSLKLKEKRNALSTMSDSRS